MYIYYQVGTTDYEVLLTFSFSPLEQKEIGTETKITDPISELFFYLLKINILVRKYLCALTVQWALYCGLLMHISSKESLPNAEQFLLNRFSRNHCQY